MSQVSRRPVSKLLEQRMSLILWNGLARLSDSHFVEEFLDDILTPTERVMVKKRLAIALLLLRNWDQEAISCYLKVSTTTVQAIKRILGLSGNGYRRIVTEIEKDKEWQTIKLDLGQALEEILAGRVGANWKLTKPAVGRKYRELRKKAEIL